MEDIYSKYSFLKDLEKQNPNLHKYTSLGEHDELIVQLEKIDGIWKDVTERELAKLELAKAQSDYNKMFGGK